MKKIDGILIYIAVLWEQLWKKLLDISEMIKKKVIRNKWNEVHPNDILKS